MMTDRNLVLADTMDKIIGRVAFVVGVILLALVYMGIL
jgi:hypothetical protein